MHHRVISLLAVAVAVSAVPVNRMYMEVHEVDSNELNPLSPEDPARHGFPTAPTVPLIPICAKHGYFRDPFNCGKFYHCHRSGGIPMAFYCQHGLIFNMDSDSCDRPEYVKC